MPAQISATPEISSRERISLKATAPISATIIGPPPREQHVGGIARQAAARHAHLDDVERGHEDVEDRGNRRAFPLRRALRPARTQPPQPSRNFARRDFPVPAALAVRAELAPA